MAYISTTIDLFSQRLDWYNKKTPVKHLQYAHNRTNGAYEETCCGCY